jgi:hypothetical protein
VRYHLLRQTHEGKEGQGRGQKEIAEPDNPVRESLEKFDTIALMRGKAAAVYCVDFCAINQYLNV